MAEFCAECWNKLNQQDKSERAYILSFDLELCEECGEWKRVVVAERVSYKLVSLLYRWIKKSET